MTEGPDDIERIPKANRAPPRADGRRIDAMRRWRSDEKDRSPSHVLEVGCLGPLILHFFIQFTLALIAAITEVTFREFRGASVALIAMALTQFAYFGPYMVWAYRKKSYAVVAGVIVIAGITILVSGLCVTVSGTRPG